MWFKSSFTIPVVAAISFCLLGGTSPAAADILHVPGDFPTIQAGIDAAVNGDEVVVADGVYTGLGNKNLNFNGRLITVRSENGPFNCIIDCEDDGRGFFFNSGETATATVQGFTIKNGGMLQYPFGVPGAGIYILNSSPTVTNCRIIACFAIPSGGGLFSSGGSPIITDCYFNQNVAGSGCDENGWGGGMYLQGGSPVVTNCDFLNGRAEGVCSGFGGGVYNRNSSPTFIDCTFSANLAKATAGCAGTDQAFGGGMYNRNSDSLLINCTFNGNDADGDNEAAGGGMYNDPDSSPTLIDCAFTGNSASDFYGGAGGALVSGSNSFLINCTFFGNVVGGGMEDGAGGAISGSPTAVNCLFVNNDAANGGAVFSGAGTFINCVMADNSADIGGGFKGGANATLTNCIIWNNTPDQINGSPTVTYSDIEGGFPGTGNIDADPLFVAPGILNYRLSPGSPCIDAADNTAMPKNIDTDLDGNPRFIDDPDTKDTGLGDCPIVDMGSYEFQEGRADCCLGDLDGNNDVGVGDMLILLGAWGPNPGHPADFDGNGAVGVSDLLVMLANWGPCP